MELRTIRAHSTIYLSALRALDMLSVTFSCEAIGSNVAIVKLVLLLESLNPYTFISRKKKLSVQLLSISSGCNFKLISGIIFNFIDNIVQLKFVFMFFFSIYINFILWLKTTKDVTTQRNDNNVHYLSEIKLITIN